MPNRSRVVSCVTQLSFNRNRDRKSHQPVQDKSAIKQQAYYQSIDHLKFRLASSSDSLAVGVFSEKRLSFLSSVLRMQDLGIAPLSECHKPQQDQQQPPQSESESQSELQFSGTTLNFKDFVEAAIVISRGLVQGEWVYLDFVPDEEHFKTFQNKAPVDMDADSVTGPNPLNKSPLPSTPEFEKEKQTKQVGLESEFEENEPDPDVLPVDLTKRVACSSSKGNETYPTVDDLMRMPLATRHGEFSEALTVEDMMSSASVLYSPASMTFDNISDDSCFDMNVNTGTNERDSPGTGNGYLDSASTVSVSSSTLTSANLSHIHIPPAPSSILSMCSTFSTNAVLSDFAKENHLSGSIMQDFLSGLEKGSRQNSMSPTVITLEEENDRETEVVDLVSEDGNDNNSAANDSGNRDSASYSGQDSESSPAVELPPEDVNSKRTPARATQIRKRKRVASPDDKPSCIPVFLARRPQGLSFKQFSKDKNRRRTVIDGGPKNVGSSSSPDGNVNEEAHNISNVDSTVECGKYHLRGGIPRRKAHVEAIAEQNAVPVKTKKTKTTNIAKDSKSKMKSSTEKSNVPVKGRKRKSKARKKRSKSMIRKKYEKPKSPQASVTPERENCDANDSDSGSHVSEIENENGRENRHSLLPSLVIPENPVKPRNRFFFFMLKQYPRKRDQPLPLPVSPSSETSVDVVTPTNRSLQGSESARSKSKVRRDSYKQSNDQTLSPLRSPIPCASDNDSDNSDQDQQCTQSKAVWPPPIPLPLPSNVVNRALMEPLVIEISSAKEAFSTFFRR